MSKKAHWEEKYSTSEFNKVSWFQEEAQTSMDLISGAAPPRASVLDVGAGASVLVDGLIQRGYEDITLLDLSMTALEETKRRLGEKAGGIAQIEADISCWTPERSFDVWHDRAVFHFLTEAEARAGYKRALLAGLVPGGVFIIGTFGLGGPSKCSGLPIVQYDETALLVEFGPEFKCEKSLLEEHSTPGGGSQLFHWAVLRRIQ